MKLNGTEYNIGLLTVIEEEKKAANICLTRLFGPPTIRQLQGYSHFPFKSYTIGDKYNKNGANLNILHLNIGAPGNVSAAGLTGAMIAENSLDAIFLVGVAGGIADKVNHFDIVIPDSIYFYEIGKLRDGNFEPYNKNTGPNPLLRNLASAVDMMEDWVEYLHPDYRASTNVASNVVFGPLAVGDKVVTDSDHAVWRDAIKHSPKTIATEMESYGCLKEAYERGVPALTVRGISDLIDDKDADHSRDRDNKEQAAARALAYTCAILRELPVAQESDRQPTAVLILSECDLSDAKMAKDVLDATFSGRLNVVLIETGSLKITIEGDHDALKTLAILVGAGLMNEWGNSIRITSDSISDVEVSFDIGRSVRSQYLNNFREERGITVSNIIEHVKELRIIDDPLMFGVLVGRLSNYVERRSDVKLALGKGANIVRPNMAYRRVTHPIDLNQVARSIAAVSDQQLRTLLAFALIDSYYWPGNDASKPESGLDISQKYDLSIGMLDGYSIIIGKKDAAYYLRDLGVKLSDSWWRKKLTKASYRRVFSRRPARVGNAMKMTYAEARAFAGFKGKVAIPSGLTELAGLAGRGDAFR